MDKENKEITVEHVRRISKKNNTEFEAICLTVGDWSTLIFPETKFECKYIYSILDEFNKK